MDGEENILGNNTIEDVSWLCSLSESELDFLISLKALVLQRAKVIGHEDIAQKFDLKMLRGLGLVLMEYLKGKVSSLSEIPGDDASLRLNASNLLKSNLGDIMSIDEIKACILKNRTAKR